MNDSGNREQAKSVEQVEVPFEPQQSPTGREEGIPLSQRRISSRQRKLSLDEYRKAFLQVPRIEDRKPVFVSGEVRDRLDEFVRRLGGRKMSVSGLLENIARLHLEIYSEDFEQWRSCDISGMTDLLTDSSHYSIQTVSSRPEGVTDKTSVLGS